MPWGKYCRQPIPILIRSPLPSTMGEDAPAGGGIRLCADQLPANVTMKSRGEHALRDLRIANRLEEVNSCLL